MKSSAVVGRKREVTWIDEVVGGAVLVAYLALSLYFGKSLDLPKR